LRLYSALPRLRDEVLVQQIGLLRRSSHVEAGTPSFARVTVERELRDDQQRALDMGDGGNGRNLESPNHGGASADRNEQKSLGQHGNQHKQWERIEQLLSHHLGQ